MEVKVGTFNLNNLFSRFNFSAEVSPATAASAEVEAVTTFNFEDPTAIRFREYRGRLVQGKPAAERETIASRILAMDLDVLAVQEVEDVDTLRAFVSGELGSAYRYSVLIEGNDPRLIDLGVISRLPIGAVTSWQHAVHPEVPGDPVFSRDLLEVEIFNTGRSKRLFTLYNNHLKSQYVPFGEDPVLGKQKADNQRRRQAETVKKIVEDRNRPDGRFIIVGDLNDTPESDCLAPLVQSTLDLVDGLQNPAESRPPRPDTPPPASARWTHRFKESGVPAHYELFD